MYLDPGTGNFILFVLQALCCVVIIAPIYAFGRFAVLSIRHSANNELPKPRFPWWAVALWVIPVVIYLVFFLFITLNPYSYTPYLPTPNYQPPTANYQPPTIVPTATRRNADCTFWSNIYPSHVGRTLCVYGPVARIEDTYAWIVRFNSARDHFYFVSASVWYPDVRVGDCVMARGEILLSAENVPYLNITDRLSNCEPWMLQ